MRVAHIAALIVVLISIQHVFAQTITIIAPSPDAVLASAGSFTPINIEWTMQSNDPATQASFRINDQPPVIRTAIEPITFFLPDGTHTLTASLLAPDGSDLPDTKSIRTFTIGAGSTSPSSTEFPAPGIEIPAQQPTTSYELPIPTLDNQPTADPYVTPPTYQESPYTPPPQAIQSPIETPSFVPYPGQDYIANQYEEPITQIHAKALPVSIPWNTQLLAGLASGFLVLILGSVLLVVRGKKGGGAPGGIDPATYAQLIQYIKQYQAWYPPSTLAAELTKSGYNQDTISAALREAQQTLRQQPQQFQSQQLQR